MTPRGPVTVIFLLAFTLRSEALASDQAANLPRGPGKAELLRHCTTCHTTDRIIAQTRSADEWSETVVRMTSLGVPISEGDQTAIIRYLSENYGI